MAGVSEDNSRRERQTARPDNGGKGASEERSKGERETRDEVPKNKFNA